MFVYDISTFILTSCTSLHVNSAVDVYCHFFNSPGSNSLNMHANQCTVQTTVIYLPPSNVQTTVIYLPPNNGGRAF